MTDRVKLPEADRRSHDVRAAVRLLYATFAKRRKGYRPWADMDFPREKLDLPDRRTVRELEPGDYEHLAWHGLCFDGERPETVKYFLPRLFEDLANGVRSPVDPEMVVSKLKEAKWRDWPPDEVEVIERFLYAWFCEAETTDKPAYPHPTVKRLRLLAFSGVPVADLVRRLVEAEPKVAVPFLVAMLDEFWNGLRNAVLRQWHHVWGSAGVEPDVIEEIKALIVSPRAARVLENAFFQTADPAVQQEISRANDILESLSAAAANAVS